MKPLQLALTPTRNRRLNEVTGMVLLVAASLLFLALASYHPTDPSLNTVAAAGRQAHNWTGVIGATVSDLLLQLEGVAAFFIPLMLGALGWTWLRSCPASSPTAKVSGVLLYLVFAPAVFGLVPGHLRWLHALPVEGLTGRLVVDTLVQYLNVPGAAIVIVSMVVIALYLSTTFSFNTAQQWMAIRFAFAYGWRDRVRNWYSARTRAKAEKQAAKRDAMKDSALIKMQKTARKAAAKAAARQAQGAEDEARRTAFEDGGAAEASSMPEPHTPSLWNQMPRTSIADRQLEEFEPESDAAHEAEELIPAVRVQTQRPAPAPQAISVKGRADAEAKLVTLAPRSVSGFRLPPSTLLHRSDETQIVREDDLREQARILVEKCAEFDVRGQVVQINPGPVVTTFEFRPEAGVKYSRVTGLAEDLCLATRAESILIERMAGKSTVGIQVPNHERETIWLRDVIEAENFTQTKSKLTLAMGKDINGRIVTADLATMPHVLIAGSTGSGKSVAITAMLMSVLY